MIMIIMLFFCVPWLADHLVSGCSSIRLSKPHFSAGNKAQKTWAEKLSKFDQKFPFIYESQRYLDN